MGDSWSAAEDALLRVHVSDGKDSAAICALFGEAGLARTQKSIQRRRERLGLHAKVAPSAYERFDRALTLEGDTLLLFDVHAPFHDAGWCNRVIDLALKWGIRNCGIGGDLIDLQAFSTHVVTVKGKRRLEADDEIEATEQITRALAANFAQVVYSGGNHEVRLARALNSRLSLLRCMEMWVQAKNISITDYHWFQVVSGGVRYQVEHPANASMHATLVPKRLCSKFGCSVVAGHGHQWGIARDDSDRYWAIDSGICADPLRLDYAVVRHNTRPKMQQGAVILRDGVPVLLSPANIGFFEGVRI